MHNSLRVCKLLWLKRILEDLKIKWECPLCLYYDNKSIISMTHNLVQHDRIKYIEVDRYFIKEKLDNGLICIPYILNEYETFLSSLTYAFLNKSENNWLGASMLHAHLWLGHSIIILFAWEIETKFPSQQIWNVNAFSRVAFSTWEAVCICIVTIGKLVKKRKIMVNNYFLFMRANETCDHILLGCPIEYNLWTMAYVFYRDY